MQWYKAGGWFHRSRHHVVVRSTGWAILHTSKFVHRLLLLCTALLVVASFLLAAGAWRLAQGPIDLDWLSDRVRAAVIDDAAPIHVSFDGISLAWEGFNRGADHPFDLRVSNIAVIDMAGRPLVEAPQAHLTFSLAGLLLGRMVPRSIEVDHARIAVAREPGGAINLGWNLAEGDAPDASSLDIRLLREQLARPVSSDHGRSRGLFDQMQRAHFRDSEVTLRDRETGLVVKTSGMDLDLVRAGAGHVHGTLRAPLLVGDRPAALTAALDWATGSQARLELTLTSPRPTPEATVPAALPILAAADLPLALKAVIGFDPSFTPTQISAQISADQGQIKLGHGSIPVRSGLLALSGTPDRITLSSGRFDVAHTPTGSPELVDLSGTVTRASNRLTAALTVGLSQIDIADLPLLWPPGVGDGARSWVTEHVTAGMVTHATGSFVVESDRALHDVAVTKATAELDGVKGTFTWIDNVPSVEQTQFRLHLVDADVLDIHVSAARQRVRNAEDLLIKDGQMRITGLSVPDQNTTMRIQVDGSVASTLALLKEPRLHLLSAHPIALKTAGGDVSAILDLQFPLQTNLQIDDMQIHADAHLARIRLLDVVAGRELRDGVFDLGVDKDGLTLKGQGAVAAIPVMFDGSVDFRPGPADQVVQKITMTGQPDATQLDAAGLRVTDVLAGPIPLTAVLTERRGGDGSVAITGDLTPATITIGPLAWNKPAANAAAASATLLMSHDRLMKIDRIAVRGDGLLLTGSGDFVDEHLRSIALDTVRLGRTEGRGSVRIGDDGLAVVLQGDQLDLAPKLTETTTGGDRSESATPVKMPNWTLDARFDHALLANGERAGNLVAKANGAGDAVRLLDAAGSTAPGSGFFIRIAPQAGKRRLLVDAKDAGTFLRGMDALKTMQSGHLTIDGVLSRPAGLYPLAATVTIDDVVVRNSPLLGKLLQAITLYGLVDALRGPGMTFSRVVVPLQYDGTNLDIDQAHAANPSLGLTAKGRINISSGQAALTGTIVPAYFFNSMLGNLPLLGKFFSPEKGGGVFAVRFSVDGLIEDPRISINPISALTPGFLREIFGVFDSAPPPVVLPAEPGLVR